MKITELNSLTEDADLKALLKQAVWDLGPLSSLEQKALEAVAQAEGEVNRLRRLAVKLNAESMDASRLYREAKRKFLANVAADLPGVDSNRGSLNRLADKSRDVTDALSYVHSFALPGAQVALIEAKIAERRAAADHLEAKAVSQKLAVALAGREAMAFDPGAQVSFFVKDEFGTVTSESLSEKQMREVYEIRAKEVDALQLELQRFNEATENEQQLVAPNLFGR
jgi:hypothetical protein